MENAKPGVGCKVVLLNEALRAQALTRSLGSFRALWVWGFFLTSRPSGRSNTTFQPFAAALVSGTLGPITGKKKKAARIRRRGFLSTNIL